MDPDGSSSNVELEASQSAFGDGAIRIWSSRLRAQVVSAGGFGGYATVHGFLASGDEAGNVDPAMSNLELGAVYHTRVTADFDVSLHAGFTLPTTDDQGLALLGVTAQRTSDLVLGLDARGTWLRGGASFGLHRGPLVARVDAGVDQHVAGRDGDGFNSRWVHLDAGLGVASRQWSAVAELQSLASLSSDVTATSVSFTVQYHAGRIAPYVALAHALDGIADDFDSDYTIAVGARVLL